MIPSFSDFETLKYIGNTRVLTEFEFDLKEDSHKIGPIRVLTDFELEDKSIEEIEFDVYVTYSDEEGYQYPFNIRDNEYQTVEQWFTISSFLLNIDDWFSVVEDKVEESKLQVLLKYEKGSEYIKKLKDIHIKKEDIMFRINGLIINMENAQEFHDFSTYILDNKKVIEELKQNIQSHLDKKLFKKKINEETHATYNSMLSRFYYWFLTKKVKSFPEVNEEVVEAFKADSQKEIHLGFYVQQKPFSKGYINQILANIVDFVENYLKKDAGVVVPFKIIPKEKETYGLELEDANKNYLYIAAKYYYLARNRMVSMSRFRDKFRNLILFRLGLESMLTNRELTRLKLSDFNEMLYELHVNGKRVYLTHDTSLLLRLYKQFRFIHDESILKEKMSYLHNDSVISFIEKFLPKEKYKELSSIDKEYRKAKELYGDEAAAVVELKEQRAREISYLFNPENGFFKEMSKNPLFEYMFVSNQNKILSINAIEKIFKDYSLKGMNLTYSREKYLAEQQVHSYVIDTVKANKTGKFKMDITSDVEKILFQNMLVVNSDDELTKVFASLLAEERFQYLLKVVAKSKGSPNIKKLRENARDYYEHYRFKKEKLGVF